MKQEIKQESLLNIWEKFIAVMIWNSIISDIIGQDRWLTFQQRLFHNILIELGSLQQRQEANQEENKMNYRILNDGRVKCSFDLLDTLQPAKVPQEEKKMFDEDFNEDNITDAKMRQETRNWFLDQLDLAFSVHIEKAKDAHHMKEHLPTSIEDFIDRIKNGKFSLTSYRKDRIFNTWDVPYHFDWRTQKADDVGYSATRAKIERAYTLAKRRLMEDRWNACHTIEKFEEMDFTPTPANDNQEKIAIAEAA